MNIQPEIICAAGIPGRLLDLVVIHYVLRIVEISQSDLIPPCLFPKFTTFGTNHYFQATLVQFLCLFFLLTLVFLLLPMVQVVLSSTSFIFYSSLAPHKKIDCFRVVNISSWSLTFFYVGVSVCVLVLILKITRPIQTNFCTISQLVPRLVKKN